jgi:hypothetical protein
VPRHSGSNYTHHTTHQKGRPGHRGIGTYARLRKSRTADRYSHNYADRHALTPDQRTLIAADTTVTFPML